jgi:two-component system chemotaxis response regulator CheB
VTTAYDGQPLRQGCAYVAPADRHLLVMGDVIRLGIGPRENMARPALDPLFRSVGISHGPRAIGVVLTGMLNDGAAGLADLRRCGGLTLVQGPADARAAEMPMGALEALDVDYRAPLKNIASTLVELSHAPVGPLREIPPDILLEVDIALGRGRPGELARIADVTPLSCPGCGGVLSQMRQGPLRFRCQVGHAYTAEALEASSEGSLDEAMRLALRIIEERSVLARKIAKEERLNGRAAAAASYERRAAESADHAETLRRAILSVQQ